MLLVALGQKTYLYTSLPKMILARFTLVLSALKTLYKFDLIISLFIKILK